MCKHFIDISTYVHMCKHTCMYFRASFSFILVWCTAIQESSGHTLLCPSFPSEPLCPDRSEGPTHADLAFSPCMCRASSNISVCVLDTLNTEHTRCSCQFVVALATHSVVWGPGAACCFSSIITPSPGNPGSIWF